MSPPVRPEAIGADPQGVPNLPRVLSPDEFEQASMVPADQLAKAKFPVLPPPFVPRDAVKSMDPTTPKDTGTPMTGLAGILTRQIAQPIANAPFQSTVMAATSMLPGVSHLMLGSMGKDILDYSAQKAAEMSLAEDQRKQAEADPERISGEQAGVEAAMAVGLPVLKSAGERAGAVAKAAVEKVPVPDGLKAHVDAIADSWDKMFAPANRSPEAKAAANIIRATTGEAAAQYEQAAFQMDDFRRSVEPLPEADKLGFIDNIEGGKTQVSPEFQKAADTIRETLDSAREQVRALGTGKLENFIENYFPHIWDDPEKAADAFKTPEEPVPRPGAAPEVGIARPRTTSGRLKALGSATPEELANEYALAKQPNVAEGVSKALTDRIEAEFSRRGVDPQEALAQGQAAIDAHATENPELGGAAGLEQAKIQAGSKRPMEGSKSFLKKRSLPTTAEGIALGLKPVSTNPVDLTLLKLREMQRYIMAHQSLHEMRDAGLVKYVAAGEVPPDGYRQINDNIATVFGKPTVTAHEAFDQNIRSTLEKTIQDIGGVQSIRPTNLSKQALGGVKVDPGTLGVAIGDRAIAVKFGTYDGVLMHELGHTIDARYKLGEALRSVPGADAEMSALATLRVEGQENVPAKHLEYIQKPEERTANAVHALLHAPDRMAEVAPNVKAALEAFIGKHDELKPLLDLKPSLAIKSGTAEIPVGGTVIRGKYHAPETVATVVNNYLSPGLRGNAIYDAYRGLGNTLNQAQLGLSAFHLMFTSMDASVSRAALGLEYLHTGLMTGDPAGLVEGLKNVVSAPVAPVTNMRLGARVRSAYLNPEGSPPDMQALANAVKEAGGRVRMDSFYQNSAPEQMMAAWHAGNPVEAAKFAIPALFETAAKPIMEHIVPMQKLGVFGDMAKKILAELPPEATLAERRAALSGAWDSVDNRMGQLVYDNLFWNKTFKDLAMGSVRSVGWNIGTIRELGGGTLDLPKIAQGELTHSAAYVMALPMIVGLYGAAYQYLRTGQGPQEMKDYFFPKTGEQDPDGNEERVQIASYMKDFFSYAGHPVQTLQHKTAPLLNATYEMLTNKDFYGDEVRNPNDPAVQQITQEANYVIKEFEPFAFRNMSEQSNRSNIGTATKVGNWFGITPAPREKVRTQAQNDMADIAAKRGSPSRTPDEAEAAATRRTLLAGLRGDKNVDMAQAVTDAISAHQVTPKEIGNLLKRAGSSPAQERFRSLTLPQAITIFKESTPKEQQLFGELLLKKVENAK